MEGGHVKLTTLSLLLPKVFGFCFVALSYELKYVCVTFCRVALSWPPPS